MKTILSTIAAVTLFAGVANAGAFDEFNDPSKPLPRASGYEQALPRTSNDDFRQALPRSVNDPFTDPSLPLPLTDETFPDITIATP
jgi:hypothetical protein